MGKAATEVAGGLVKATLGNNHQAPAVFGCNAKRASAGNVQVTLDNPVDLERVRLFVTVNGSIATNYTVGTEWVNDRTFLVLTWTLGVNNVPALTQVATNFDFSFSVSTIPD